MSPACQTALFKCAVSHALIELLMVLFALQCWLKTPSDPPFGIIGQSVQSSPVRNSQPLTFHNPLTRLLPLRARARHKQNKKFTMVSCYNLVCIVSFIMLLVIQNFMCTIIFVVTYFTRPLSVFEYTLVRESNFTQISASQAPLPFSSPFFPTNENAPLENHRSLASFTRCRAAALFVNSKPRRNRQ